MNKISILLLVPAILAVNVINAYALVQKYDEDGFTIFADKNFSYMQGYRDEVLQADQDIKTKFDTQGIDAHQDKIKCPPNSEADFCLRFKDGYSDEAMDQLE
jgi:hypothetical protein